MIDRLDFARFNLVTMMLAGGDAGYLPDDASYIRSAAFEVEHARVAPGCAERAIIEGAAGPMAR